MTATLRITQNSQNEIILSHVNIDRFRSDVNMITILGGFAKKLINLKIKVKFKLSRSETRLAK